MSHPSIVLRVIRTLDPKIGAGSQYLVPASGGTLGRGRTSSICIPSVTVSRTHARLALGASGWHVTQLTGTNGTFVDDTPVVPGVEALLSVGATLQVGGIALEVLRLLPSHQPVTVPVLRALDGTAANVPGGLSEARFCFEVSRDEESARWSVELNNHQLSLGSRSHVYLLATLARLRLAERHLPVEDRGWTYSDALASGLNMTPATMKVQVYRARKQLRGVVLDAQGIIERRPTSGQIRIGTDRLVVQ